MKQIIQTKEGKKYCQSSLATLLNIREMNCAHNEIVLAKKANTKKYPDAK